jgi:hypothetical protein
VALFINTRAAPLSHLQKKKHRIILRKISLQSISKTVRAMSRLKKFLVIGHAGGGVLSGAAAVITFVGNQWLFPFALPPFFGERGVMLVDCENIVIV